MSSKLNAPILKPSTATQMALPARAIRSRLQAATETPSWAEYLPRLLAQQYRSSPFGPIFQGGQTFVPLPPGVQVPTVAVHEQTSTGRMSPSAQTMPSVMRLEPQCKGSIPKGEGKQGSMRTQVQEIQPKATKAKDSKSSSKVSIAISAVQVLRGQVLANARDEKGCREVQNALEAGTDEERQAIASELEGHVWEALRCPHANHVLQKCIVTLRPQASQFIIDEVLQAGTPECSGASQAARHRYGCRILERLIEHCSHIQVAPLLEELVADAVSLSKHPYGNYVIQHLLEHGPADEKHRIAILLQANAHTAGTDCYARAVISKALSHGQQDDQLALARALLQEPNLVFTMARTRHGHVAAKFILQNLKGHDLEEARRQLSQNPQALRASRYGRFVAAILAGGTSEGSTGSQQTRPGVFAVGGC